MLRVNQRNAGRLGKGCKAQMTTSTNSAPSLGTSSTNGALTLFEYIARTTSEWLGQARQLKLSFSEETITDIAALQIAGAASNQVKVAKTTRQQEKGYGIDWMWFIGNPRQGYNRYAVQAKKMTLDSTANFSYRLRYRVSGIPGSEFQIERLEQFAKRARAIPLYCFYNNVNSALATKYWHCRTYHNQPDDIRQMGCTVVPLDAVQVLHKPHHRKDFAAVHQDSRSVPWRCLFHPRCLAAGIHSGPDYRKGLLAGQPPQDDPISFPRSESLPEFLMRDNPVVEIADVVQQLELIELLDDRGSEAMLTSTIRSAIPEWFVVIESDLSQLAVT